MRCSETPVWGGSARACTWRGWPGRPESSRSRVACPTRAHLPAAQTTLGSTRRKIRTPEAAGHWTWLIIIEHTQLRLARPFTEDLRRPSSSLICSGEITPLAVVAILVIPVDTGLRPARPLGGVLCPVEAVQGILSSTRGIDGRRWGCAEQREAVVPAAS